MKMNGKRLGVFTVSDASCMQYLSLASHLYFYLFTSQEYPF